MARSKPIQNNAVTESERTWRMNLETPSSSPHSIQVYRETVPLDSNSEPVGQPKQSTVPVNRMFDDVKDETATIGSGSISVENVFAALEQFADRWAEEDEGDK